MKKLVVMFALALAAPAAAQAPRVTPAGDPSVRSDTIYSLAVRPEDHPDAPYIYLLDDGVVIMEADGRGSRTYRQVIQILTREAAETWGELSFSWSPGRERLTVNWVRVLDLTGRVVHEGPAHEQESRADVAQSAPIYTDQMVRRLSLGGVAPGTIVDYSYTTEVIDPVVPDDFYSSWSVTTGQLTRRSRYIVEAPERLNPRFIEHNWRWEKPTAVTRGRRTWLYARNDVPKYESEPFAGRPDTVAVGLELAAPRTWAQVGRWYDSLAQGRYDLTPAVRERFAPHLAAARTLEDSLRAAHRWVAQDFRYVSLSLGIGGYQPRGPAQMLETMYGDCKDKATLFIALARSMGVRAWPVLLSQAASADSALPTVRQFDHLIAAVEWPGRRPYLYLDLTADLTPFGELPYSEQGGFAVVIKDRGRVETVRLPLDSVTANRLEMVIEGDVDTAGRFNGRMTESGTGSRQYSLRNAFVEPYSADERDRFVRNLASRIFPESSGDSLMLFDGRDLLAPARITLALRGGRAITRASGIEIIELPIQNLASPQLARELAERGPRRLPIDVASVVGPTETFYQVTLRLPEGWQARLPERIEATSVFGSYRAEYVQTGREVRVTRVLRGARGTQPPEKITELIDWLRSLSRDDVRFLVIERRGA